jgi:tetratricopeptide (TPR) repeat protein
VVQLRARLLAETLDRADEARALLNDAAERSRNSAPLVQLGLLDLQRRDYEAVGHTIAKIRGRWKEAAAADLLEAQLALARGDLATARDRFNTALKKDPDNKVVQFAKAQLDAQTGASAEAAREFEQIARDKPVKELEPGFSLMTAAQAALATQALNSGDYDGAIHRLEDLIRGDQAGEVTRAARWQLASARAAKGDWASARREVAALLNDPKTPPTADERVQAANLYRTHGEEDAARAQLDRVLKDDPANPAAVVVRAYMLTNAAPPQPAQAVALLRRAIAASKQPPDVFYLMLAAVENISPPEADALARAQAALDQGLARHPDSMELVRAKYRALRLGADPAKATAFVEEKARADKKGTFRRLLVDVYRDEQKFDRAEAIVRELMHDDPQDRQLAAALVSLVGSRAIQAGQAGDRARERKLSDETAALIKSFRAQFPTDPSFAQAECQLAMRQGDLARALAVAQELEEMDKASPVGPLLRARIYQAQQTRTAEVAKALREALVRNPRQPQVRIELARASLTLGEPAEALEQIKLVLDAAPDNPAALLLRARALSAQEGPPAQVEARRTQAIQGLRDAIARRPTFAEAYHQIAEIQLAQGRRADAVKTLGEDLKAVPEDATGLSLLVQTLTGPREGGKPAPDADVRKAKEVAEQFGGKDAKGTLCLALAVGFHKANRVDLALPWAEKASRLLDSPVVHENYGDMLLAAAEAATDQARARDLFTRALAEYDKTLKGDANSLVAINNKAWILHRHFDDNQEALELVRGLMRRVDPSTLPGEFYDTLGSIQEALGKVQAAEGSYAEGLRRSEAHPVLNYHMGRLLASDKERAAKARIYLERAQAANDQLPPSMAAEVDTLLRTVGR